MTALAVAMAAVVGALLWTLAEYLLHRFAMHQLRGKGIMSREHLEHHVQARWNWSSIFLLSWAGMLLVGFVAWMPLGWILVSFPVGLAVALGWTLGYAQYEYQHAVAHRRAPRGRYSAWVRHHHFHHHFGHPMANHGVSVPWWDVAFGTLERPDRVRVPRRLAMDWLVDADGTIRPEHRDRYVLVGATDASDRQAALDRARAFASVAPTD